MGTTYYYQVTATDEEGETRGSVEVSATPSGSNQSVSIKWKFVDGAVSYRIYRSTTAGGYGATSLVGSTTTRNLTDTGDVLTTGTLPTSSTVAQPKMLRGVECTGHLDHSDVVIRNNRFYLPNAIFTGQLIKEYTDTVLPRIFEGNEFHDSTGVTTEFLTALGNKSGSFTIDPSVGRIQTATLNGNITPTISTGTHKGQTLDLELTQDATGSRTCAKPVNSKVPGGTMPISTAANARDLYRWRWDGSAWLLVSYQLNVS